MTKFRERIEAVYAGSVVYPPGGKFGPRVQQDVQLVMLYSGEMHVNISGRDLHVAPGHVALLKPGHEEMFQFSKSEETWHRWIAIHIPDMDCALMDQLNGLPECIPLSEDMNRLLDLMLRIQQYTAPTDPLLQSLGAAAIELYPAETSLAIRQQEKHPAVYKALSWIRDHYASEITLQQLAEQADVSKEHLVRLFRLHEGVSPVHYVWRYRVEQAIGMLTNTGLSITEIAHRCGFKTSHHFARAIKQATGHTASEMRLSSWGGLRTRSHPVKAR